jgi:hypothetical protein
MWSVIATTSRRWEIISTRTTIGPLVLSLSILMVILFDGGDPDPSRQSYGGGKLRATTVKEEGAWLGEVPNQTHLTYWHI